MLLLLNLIAFIISIKTEASLLALAKSIYIVCLHSISSVLDILYNTYFINTILCLFWSQQIT